MDAHLGDSPFRVCFLTFRSCFAELYEFRSLGLDLSSPLLGHRKVVKILRL